MTRADDRDGEKRMAADDKKDRRQKAERWRRRGMNGFVWDDVTASTASTSHYCTAEKRQLHKPAGQNTCVSLEHVT